MKSNIWENYSDEQRKEVFDFCEDYRQFISTSKTERECVKYAVAEAEKKLGSGTGQLKLRYVYNMFIAKFPAIALFIDFEDFSHMVDNALLELECMISSNDNIKNVIGIEDK